MRIGDFYFAPDRWQVGDLVFPIGVSYGPKVYLVWKGKRHFVLHVPSHDQYWGMRRHSILASFYIMKMNRKDPRPRKPVRDRLGSHLPPQEWECEMVKIVEPGKRSVRIKREIIAEAESLDANH